MPDLTQPRVSVTMPIGLLERELRERAGRDQTAKRLMTIPGVGVLCAVAMEALAPPSESFAKGRDFAAWLDGKTLPAARRGWVELRRWVSAICADCGSVAQ
jgi:transposase